MRGIYYRTEKDGTPLATPELRISATNNRTVYYDNQNAKEAALQNDEIKEGSIVLTGYADGESEVVIKQEPDWENAVQITRAQLETGYVCPSDGIVVGWFRTNVSSNTEINMKINGVTVSRGWQGSETNCWDGNVQCPVTSGDTVKVDGRSVSQLAAVVSFVPFKTVAEPLTLPVNLVPEKDKYSYTEVKTNKVWVDGKPIYRKAGIYNNGGTIGTEQILLDSTLTTSYIDTVIATGGSAYDDSEILSIGGYSGHAARLCLAIHNDGLVKMVSSITYTKFKWWIEYTKN